MEQNEMTLVRPFILEHPLKFCEEIRKFEQQYCNACRLELSGPGYICENCNLFFLGYRLHESCAKLPNEIQHLLHPTHHLNLYARSPYMLDYIISDECEDFCLEFIYLCEKCDFKLDLKCATRTIPRSRRSGSKESDKETELYHFSHKHKLIFCNFNDPRCGWILQEFCLELPQETRAPIHSQHVSILSYMRHGRCHACGQLLPSAYYYGCKDRHLNFHITCAVSICGNESLTITIFTISGQNFTGSSPCTPTRLISTQVQELRSLVIDMVLREGKRDTLIWKLYPCGSFSIQSLSRLIMLDRVGDND